MDFIWNDGGRSAAGFVGLTGDCVTRAIAIATGVAYRDVYRVLGDRTLRSPRHGIASQIADAYLEEHGWQSQLAALELFALDKLPKGIVIVELEDLEGHSGHFCTVIDHVLHDTWNPADDERYVVTRYWTQSERAVHTHLPATGPKRRVSREQELTQGQFEKILRRLRALDNTATNDASTEGEKRNALRMMQSLMLTHNLTREDIADDDNVDHVQFTRVACPVNGRRACTWEKSLASYVVREIFPTVQWYSGTKGHRTLFWFYGPVSDVENCLALFRELILTIATAAHLRYGGYTRGSGASYAEGYVAGLPRAAATVEPNTKTAMSQNALIHARTLALRDASRQWLDIECDIQLTTSSGRGRYQRDPAAERQGRKHGSQHEIHVSGRRDRITHQ